MSFERQIHIPASFVAIYTPSGRVRPEASRLWLEERYELCEDLSQLLANQVKDKVWQMGITESDALERVEHGLEHVDLELSDSECQWVMTRTKEVLALGSR
jgi:hypothetical protein